MTSERDERTVKRVLDWLLTFGAVLALPVIVVGLWNAGGQLRDGWASWSSRRANAVLADSVLRAYSGAAVLGNPAGHRSLIAFVDYRCPVCKVADSLLATALDNDEDLRVVVLQYPLDTHPAAYSIARAAVCAGDRTRFGTLHRAFFRAQEGPGPQPVAALVAATHVDSPEAIASCADSLTSGMRVQREKELGARFGVVGTPTFVTRDGRRQGLDFLVRLAEKGKPAPRSSLTNQ